MAYETHRLPEEIHLFAATFSTPEEFKPQLHAFYAEKLSWLHINDNLPKYSKEDIE